jgi:hypothetical protein
MPLMYQNRSRLHTETLLEEWKLPGELFEVQVDGMSVGA